MHKLCSTDNDNVLFSCDQVFFYFSQQGEGRERTLDTIASHNESVLLVVQNLDFLLIDRKTKESFKVVQDSFQHFSRLIIRFWCVIIASLINWCYNHGIKILPEQYNHWLKRCYDFGNTIGHHSMTCYNTFDWTFMGYYCTAVSHKEWELLNSWIQEKMRWENTSPCPMIIFSNVF